MKYYNIENDFAESEFITTSCHVCGNNKFTIKGIDNGFRIVKCTASNCGYVFVNPRPSSSQLKNFYNKYYPEGELTAIVWTNEMNEINVEARNLLSKFKSSGHVLDIGSSFGQFLCEAEKIGWKGTGIEPSHSAASYSKKVCKSLIIEGMFEDITFEDESFDAVVSFYVMEHVLDPHEFLKKIHRLLKPNGIAIIRVPHSEPLMPLFRLLGRSILQAPMHLNDFSPRSFNKLASNIGFSNCEASIGKLRKPTDFVERVGSLIFGVSARIAYSVTFGAYLSPLSGAKRYILKK